MLAWRRYQRSLHEACGQPIDRAWHPRNDATFYEPLVGICHACTAVKQAAQSRSEKGGSEAVEPVLVVLSIEDTRDHDAHPLPEFRLDDFDD